MRKHVRTHKLLWLVRATPQHITHLWRWSPQRWEQELALGNLDMTEIRAIWQVFPFEKPIENDPHGIKARVVSNLKEKFRANCNIQLNFEKVSLCE